MRLGLVLPAVPASGVETRTAKRRAKGDDPGPTNRVAFGERGNAVRNKLLVGWLLSAFKKDKGSKIFYVPAELKGGTFSRQGRGCPRPVIGNTLVLGDGEKRHSRRSLE